MSIEAALRASEERLSLAVEAANVGLWDLDVRTGQVVFSREWKSQLGYEPHEIPDEFSEWERRIHPDDIGPTLDLVNEYLAQPRGVYEVEFRMRHKDGSWRWIHARGNAVCDAEGKTLRVLGCHIDITSSKLDHERIAQLNRTHSVLNGINQVMLREREPQPIFDQACRVAVETGRFRLAWIGLAHGPTSQLQIAAHAGADPATLDVLEDIFGDPQLGCAFTARAFQTGAHAICNDIASNPLAAPWREAALERGYRSMVSLALAVSGRSIGTMNLYAPERNFFDTEEMQLLDALAGDIAFAIEGCERERERAIALAKLCESEERFREIAETIDEAFWISEADARAVLYISPAYEQIWGRTSQSIRNAPGSWSDAIHPDDRERINAALQILRNHGQFNEEYRIFRPDGTERWVRDKAFPVLDSAGKPTRIVGVARDITARKLLESQVRQSQKIEAVGQLAGGIAHDFNNLIGTILGNAELARMDLSEGHAALESIKEIARAGRRAKELVNRLLTFSRPAEQQLKPIQLDCVVDEAARLLRSTLPAGVELTVQSAPALPAVKADASQVHQIILNLVTNSWHAMELNTGRIEVEIAAQQVDSEMQRTTPELQIGRYVRLSVKDTGKGMDADTQDRIFEPFFTTKPPDLGTGLGLPVVHGIMRSHGGGIRVDSRPGKGTTFHLFFPVTHEEAGSSASGIYHAPKPNGRGQHILFVDDEEPLVSLVTRLLTHTGYRVTGLTSPTQALAAFEADPESFDLIITDFNMPGMSGVVLAEALLRRRPDAPIVLASGYLSAADIEKAKAAGVREVIGKPNAIEDLASMVKRLLPSD